MRRIVPFLFAFLVAAVAVAGAQTGGFVFSDKESARTHGEFIIGWNATTLQIDQGTLVMADTTGSTANAQVTLGKGFSAWSGRPQDVHRLLGILIGNTPGGAQGRILVRGFYNYAPVESTGYAGNDWLRASLFQAGRFARKTFNDTTWVYYKRPIGVFQRYANKDSLRAYIWFDVDMQ